MPEPYVAEIRLFAGNFAPSGWALCNGQLIAIVDNDPLFQVIGTTYGGDGITNFAVPDLRGRSPICFGQGAGLTDRVLGEAGGTESQTLDITQIPAHSHVVNASAAPGDATSPAGAAPAVSDASKVYSAGTPNATMAAGTIGNAGDGQAHNNMSPYLAINYIISLFGVFPSQAK